MAEKLKDIFFQRPFYDDLVAALKMEYPGFREDVFLGRVFDDDWEERALKERVRHTTLSIRDLLPDDYRQALEILRHVSSKMNVYGFENMLFPDLRQLFQFGIRMGEQYGDFVKDIEFFRFDIVNIANLML